MFFFFLADFKAKEGREDIFKPTIRNEILHEVSNDNGVKAVSFATFITSVVESTMFPHRDIHKYTYNSLDRKTHYHAGHVLIDRRRHSSMADISEGLTAILTAIW
jgi:hypothetical protein